MTAHQPKHPKVSTGLPAEVPSAAIPFLLDAYRHGLLELGNSLASEAFLTKLVTNNYCLIHHDKQSGTKVSVMQLTQKGASFIENNFMDILTEFSPYYIFPVIKTGDRVELLVDIKNEQDEKTGVIRRAFISPSGSSTLDKGVYKVMGCDESSIVVTDECFIQYRLRLSMMREKLRLNAADLRTESEELKSRFGKIRVHTIVERLSNKLHTIKLAELVDELYNMPHTKDRINNG